MNILRDHRLTSDPRPLSRRPADPLEGPGPWIVFAVGLLLMLAAALVRGDDPATARRTEKFNATLPARSTLRVLNVSGDVVATAGREFSAVCTTTVTASTKARAEEIRCQAIENGIPVPEISRSTYGEKNK